MSELEEMRNDIKALTRMTTETHSVLFTNGFLKRHKETNSDVKELTRKFDSYLTRDRKNTCYFLDYEKQAKSKRHRSVDVGLTIIALVIALPIWSIIENYIFGG